MDINAQGISSGVTFNWANNQSNLSDAANLDFIEINGAIYNMFVVPSAYEMSKVGHGGNHIWRNGTQIVGSSNTANWNSEAIKAYQSINLNHYFESNSNGDGFCGNFGAASSTTSQIQTITYNAMLRGFRYMNAIINMYSRKILNWSVSNSMDKEGCIELLANTIARYGAPEIHNSNQGSQYTSTQYIDVVKNHEI
jgi:hypothetical protein